MNASLKGYTSTEIERIERKITDRIQQIVGIHFDRAWGECPHLMSMARRCERVRFMRFAEERERRAQEGQQ